VVLKSKSLYRSPAVRDIYETGIEIWAGFGPIGSTEKKEVGPIMSKFGGWFFHIFRGKNVLYNFLKNILASPLKSYIK
jgi:hypothetical protein